jgi:hypothetical protein
MTTTILRVCLPVAAALLLFNCKHRPQSGDSDETVDSGASSRADAAVDAGPPEPSCVPDEDAGTDADGGTCARTWFANVTGDHSSATIDGGALVLDVVGSAAVNTAQINVTGGELKGDFGVVIQFKKLVHPQSRWNWDATLNCDTSNNGAVSVDLSDFGAIANYRPQGSSQPVHDTKALTGDTGSIRFERVGRKGKVTLTVQDGTVLMMGDIGTEPCTLYMDLASASDGAEASVRITEIDLAGSQTGTFTCDLFDCDSLHP